MKLKLAIFLGALPIVGHAWWWSSPKPVAQAAPPPAQTSSGVSEPRTRNAAFQIFGDLLYWQPAVSRLPYAISVHSETLPTFGVAIPTKEKIHSISFHYEPGFRLGLASRFQKGYDILIDWAHLRCSSHSRMTAEGGRSISAIWDIYLATNEAVKASQSMRYDQVNLDFVKHVSVGHYFSLHPFFGAEGGFIEQDLKIRFTQEFGGLPAFARSKISNHYHGGGLQIGLSTSYDPVKWISLYAKGYYGLLFGDLKFTKRSLQQIESEEFGTLTYNYRQSTRESAFVSNFDIQTGFKLNWSSRHWALSFLASYEFNFWPNLVHTDRFYTAVAPDGATPTILSDAQGDTGFQGVSVGLMIGF